MDVSNLRILLPVTSLSILIRIFSSIGRKAVVSPIVATISEKSYKHRKKEDEYFESLKYQLHVHKN